MVFVLGESALSTPLILFALFNLAVIFLLVAAPLDKRTFRMRRRIAASPARVMAALDPFGQHSGWSGTILSAERTGMDGSTERGEISLSWPGRDGQPIRRTIDIVRDSDGQGFSERVVEDSSLDHSFWKHWSNHVRVEGDGDAATVGITRTDSYRGAAFLIFRWFAARRELAKLKVWAETGTYKPGGIFEHPMTQVAMSVVSMLILWPFFGLTPTGFILSLTLTLVVAAHELGHMAAFRLMGHANTRMIFIPVLGGIAIGGRPYDSRYEIGFVALMGSGFSAFLVPLAIAGHSHFTATGQPAWAAFCGSLAACAAFFNLANLAPMWKFDGGQVLRQITPDGWQRTAGAMVILMAMAAIAWAAGFPSHMVIVALATIALLSLITSRSSVKPRHAMKPISRSETRLITAGLAAVIATHGAGIIWAMKNFL